MDTIYKYFHIDKGEFDEKDFIVTATASKEIVDREGDVIKVKGIDTKNWKKNPVIMLFHNYNDFPVGVGVGRKAWVEGNELKIKFKFLIEENDKAFQAARLWKAGALRGLSVGFLADHNEVDFPEKSDKAKMPNRIFNKVELLEVSVVPIPANQEALMASVSKSIEKGELEEEDREVLKALLDTQLEEKKETIDYINISSTGDAANFGDLTKAKEEYVPTEDVILTTDDQVKLRKLVLDAQEKLISEYDEKAVEKDQKIDKLEQKIREYELEQELKEVETDDDYLNGLFSEYKSDMEKLEQVIEDAEEFDNYLSEILEDKVDEEFEEYLEQTLEEEA